MSLANLETFVYRSIEMAKESPGGEPSVLSRNHDHGFLALAAWFQVPGDLPVANRAAASLASNPRDLAGASFI